MKREKIKYRISNIDQRPPTLSEAKSRDPNFNGWEKLSNDPQYIELMERIKKRRQEKID